MADLLGEAIRAHGGLPRWQRAREVRAHVRGGGLLMRTKLKHRKFSDYRVRAETRAQRAEISPYPRAAMTGVFEAGSVRLLDGEGAVVAEREHAREAFSGASGLWRKLRWDDLDALYFAAYAMWNYLSLPFLLAGEGFGSREGEPIEVEGERWRRLDVVFPERLHTHCREQSFYFDPRGLLRRHDYHPDVVSSRADAAHLSWDHREFDGLVFPTSRRVVPKGPGGRLLPGPKIVTLELDAVEIGQA